MTENFIKNPDLLAAEPAVDINAIEKDQQLMHRARAVDSFSIVMELNISGRITYVNNIFCEFSGYSRGELIGKTYHFLSSGHHDRAFFRDIWVMIEAGKQWSGEVLGQGKEGIIYWVQTMIFPINNAAGQCSGCIVMLVDIAKSQKIQMQRPQAEAKRYQETEVAIMRRMDSRKSEEQSDSELLRVNHELRVHQIELEMQNEELRRTHVDLDILRERYFNLFNLAPFGYCILGASNNVIESNRTVGELLGLSNDLLIGQPMIRYIYREDRDIFYLLDKQIIVNDTLHQERELRMLRKNGTIFWAHLKACRVRGDEKNRFITWLIFSDITQRKYLEQDKIERTRSAAEAIRIDLAIKTEQVAADQNLKIAEAVRHLSILDSASRIKSEFIANMSHEIRTPIAIIRGYSELLMKKTVDIESQSWINTILISSHQLESLVNDSLDLSKIEAGKLEVESTVVSIRQIISELRGLLVFKASEKGIDLTFSVEGAVPSEIVSDPLRLRQILLNVISNSIKFTQKGGVELTVSFKSDGDENGASTLIFSVTDSGIGMTADQQEKIFEAFNQADSTITKRFGGTGLGLSISLRLARLLGGGIEVGKSEVDKGNTFIISINPGSIGEGAAMLQGPSAFEDKLVDVAVNVPAADNLKGMKILLIEDSVEIRALVSHVLLRQGAIVTEAVNGEEGIEFYRKSNFDLIIMDIQMPVMDGGQAIQLLRSEGCLLPVFAMTSHAMVGERERCILNGFTDYLSKPINFGNLSRMAGRYRQAIGPAGSSKEFH